MADPRDVYKLNPRKVSKSKVEHFDECPDRYKRLHVDGIEVTPGEAQLAGTIGHEALLILQRFVTEPTVEQIESAVLHAPTQAVGNQGARTQARALLIDAIDMIDFADTIACEEAYEVDLGEGFSLNGTLDRIDLPSDEPRLKIVDYKFGRWVPPWPLEDDAQAQFYLTLARHNLARILKGRKIAGSLSISFERHWVALQWKQGPLYYSAEIETKARARALTHLRAVAAEKEWNTRFGTHCKQCDFVGSCARVTEELERRTKILPIEAVTLPSDQLMAKFKEAKATAAIATARADKLDEQVRAVLNVEGRVMGAEFHNSKGWRNFDNVAPELVTQALLKSVGSAPDPTVIETRGTNAEAVKSFVKKLPKKLRLVAEEGLDVVAPRKIRQRVKFGKDDAPEGDE